MKARSLLFIPAHDQRKIEKGLHSDADIVIFDLEDAVADTEKETARQTLKQQLQLWSKHTFPASPQIYVRINGIRTA